MLYGHVITINNNELNRYEVDNHDKDVYIFVFDRLEFDFR